MLRSSSTRHQLLFTLLLLGLCAVAGYGADPGNAFPAASEVSDQKTGAVLIYNFYNSSPAGGNTQNTRFTLTNTSTNASAFVHLFFVSSDGTVSDAYICLTPVQTAAFLASDIDPGVQGYMVAVAVDVSGCPQGFNFLCGEAYIKRSAGQEAALPAEAYTAQFSGVMPGCSSAFPSTTLSFDGSATGYNRAARMLAADKLRSSVDGNQTLVVVNRIGGSLMTGVSTTGTLGGVLYDDLGNQSSFTLNTAVQVNVTLTDAVAPGYSTFVPSGHTGWLKIFHPTNDVGLSGAVLNFNSAAGSNASAFTGGHNLRKLTFSTSNAYTIPVFPPNC